MKGKPRLDKNVFAGRTVIIDWSKQDNGEGMVIRIRGSENSLFSCTINKKKETIAIEIEDLKD